MSTSLARDRVRLQFDPVSHSAASCRLRGNSPSVWRGADLQVEVALYFGGTILDSFTNIAALYLDILPGDDRDGAPLISKASSAAPAAVTEADWLLNDPTKYAALFEFSKTEMQVDMTGASDNKRTFWLVCHAVTTDATPRYITYGAAQLVVEEDGAQNGLSVVGPMAQNWRIKQVGNEQFLQIYNADTAKWNTIMVTGAAATEQLALGAGQT